MPSEEIRYMWLMVFFDLPVKTKPERKAATGFRQFLLKDGYIMLQLSVYSRLCQGQGGINKHLKRLVSNLPPDGSVRALQVTDQQFARMKLLLGERKSAEKLGHEQLILL